MVDNNEKGIWRGVPSAEQDFLNVSKDQAMSEFDGSSACKGKHQLLCLQQDVFWHIYVWTQEQDAL